MGNTRLLIDCGIKPGLLGAESLPKLASPQGRSPPDALIITHAHSDHVGALVLLKLMFPDLPVFITDATARITITRPMLLDAAKVAGRNGSPMFNEADVIIKALQQVSTISPDVPFKIGEVRLLPGRGGYIVEAVGLMLEHKSGLRIWHTADVNTVAILTTDAAYLPPEADTVTAARGKLFSSCSARSVTSTVPGIASGST